MDKKNIKNIQECDIWTYNKLTNKVYITTYIKETVKIDEETNIGYIERTPWVVYTNN